jgi:sortase A
MRRIEATFWLVGLSCLGFYAVTQMHSARAQTAAIAELEAQWEQQEFVEPDRSLWSEQRIAAFEHSRTTSNALSPQALLNIPAVGIRVAVFDGTSDRVLNLGAGRVAGTGEFGADGNLALAGHRDGFFRGLKDITIGDDIELQHAGGLVTYSVTELFVVDPDAVHVLEPTRETTLTLITCYPFYFVGHAPQRFIVRAVAKAT